MTTPPMVPRPDQRLLAPLVPVLGSRSGSGDLAGALGYPGVPAAVPNCQSAKTLLHNIGLQTFFTFPAAGRIWQVVLTYTITANASFSLASVRTYAQVLLSPSGLTLAVVNLGVSGASEHAEGQSEPPVTGLPVTSGQSLVCDVNNGAVVPQLDQQASAVVLYSVP